MGKESKHSEVYDALVRQAGFGSEGSTNRRWKR